MVTNAFPHLSTTAQVCNNWQSNWPRLWLMWYFLRVAGVGNFPGRWTHPELKTHQCQTNVAAYKYRSATPQHIWVENPEYARPPVKSSENVIHPEVGGSSCIFNPCEASVGHWDMPCTNSAAKTTVESNILFYVCIVLNDFFYWISLGTPNVYKKHKFWGYYLLMKLRYILPLLQTNLVIYECI